jgi:predicted ATPase
MARIIEAWSLAMHQQTDVGVALAHRGLDELRSQQSLMRLSYMVSVAAECEAAAGLNSAALTTLEAAVEEMQRTGERRWEPEMYRLRGQFLLGEGKAGCEPEAEAAFLRALEVARGQEARSLELRAATSLARFWAEHRRSQARDLLASRDECFTEGFDTPDLKASRALLDELG